MIIFTTIIIIRLNININIYNKYNIMNNEEYIIYISGGLLGDFFSQLSVIKENYIKYNKKGLLYISDIKEKFRNPLEAVYKDTYDIIILQDYIYDYKIYNNENYDVNLSSWRNNSLLFKTNFHLLFSNEYNITWGKNKWLNVPYDNKWKNIVFINTVPYSFVNNVNYDEYKLKYPDFKFIFISIDKDHYDFFISKTKQYDIEHYCPESLLDTSIAINSCELFMGNTSALLCIAYSLNKKSITIDSCIDIFNILHSDMRFLNTNYKSDHM